MISNAYRMFNFDLGETADAIRETVFAFSSNEIAPRAAEIDKSNQFPRDLWPKIGALGGGLPVGVLNQIDRSVHSASPDGPVRDWLRRAIVGTNYIPLRSFGQETVLTDLALSCHGMPHTMPSSPLSPVTR